MTEPAPDIAATLARAAGYGPYFTVRLADPPAQARGLAELYRGDGPGTAIETVRGRLGDVPARVAASTFFLGWAAQLASPVLGCWQLGGLVLDLDPRRTHWTTDALFTADPGGHLPACAAAESVAEAIDATLVASHLAPMISAITRTVRVAEPLLWGNAAAAVYGALRVLRHDPAFSGHAVPGTEAVVHALLRRGPLAGTATLEPEFRRRSCCLFYRVPGGGLCAECPLPRVPRDGTRRRSQPGHTPR